MFLSSMRKLAAFCLLALGVVSVASGQEARPGFDLTNYGVRVEPDKRVMVVLAALEMASGPGANGVEEKLIRTPLSDSGSKFRDQLLKDNAGLSPDVRQKISLFVAQHKRSRPKMSDADLIAPFISMAYALSPVPELADPVITNDLPGSLLDVLDFAPLVREFYRRSTIGSKLDDYVNAYRAEADSTLRRTAREMVSDLLDYLHTRPRLVYTERVVTQQRKAKSKTDALQQIEKRENERRFFLVPELLAAKGTINFVNVRDDYYVILPPDTDLSFSDVRRAFLQFVVDPLVLENSRELAPVLAFVRSNLAERRKTDTGISSNEFLAVTRSLVAAVDVRQTQMARSKIATEIARERISKLTSADQKKQLTDELETYKLSLADEAALRLYEDYERGAVLSFYFAEQLKGVEDSGFDIASSMREMVASFDAAKEPGRVAATAEARKRAAAARDARKGAAPETRLITAENPVTTKLLEVQKLINGKELAKAATELKALLVQNPKEPRIYYNLGRVAGLEAAAIEDPDEQSKKLLEAKNAYVEVLRNATAGTDVALLSLTYVSLARIYEHNNDKEYAIKLYDQAIRLDDVRGGGYSEALAAKQRLLKP
jgi:tetratricopeptide (TPR) repeat protein